MGWRNWLGIPEKRTEVRQIEWPFNVGPPSYLPDVNSADTALTYFAVFAAVRLLAESVACLPLHTYRDTGSRRQRVPTSWLNQPSPYCSRYDWIYMCMTSLLLHGNAYGLVTSRDGFQFPTAIEWLRNEQVTVEGDPTSSNPLRVKVLYGGRELPRQDVFHIRAFARAGRFEGVSPIRNFAETFAGGLAAQKYGNDWYAAGGFPPGTFKNSEQTVDQEAAGVMKSRLNQAIQSRQPLVYGKDWDYTPLTVPPNEAQFLGAMKLNATQVAAAYDIPPERLGGEPGGSLTYATQEQDQIRLALTTQKWCTRLEDALFGLLPERRYVKFNVDAMIRTDTKTRRDVFKIDREIGLKSIDELRELEDLEPLPNGEGSTYLPLEAQISEAQPRRALTEPEDEAQPRRPRLVS